MLNPSHRLFRPGFAAWSFGKTHRCDTFRFIQIVPGCFPHLPRSPAYFVGTVKIKPHTVAAALPCRPSATPFQQGCRCGLIVAVVKRCCTPPAVSAGKIPRRNFDSTKFSSRASHFRLCQGHRHRTASAERNCIFLQRQASVWISSTQRSFGIKEHKTIPWKLPGKIILLPLGFSASLYSANQIKMLQVCSFWFIL